jgi:hypothetical protein
MGFSLKVGQTLAILLAGAWLLPPLPQNNDATSMGRPLLS